MAAPIQFLGAMLAAEAVYPGYSPVQNFVSDLGASGSPWAALFNASLLVLGSAAFLGTVLVRREFPVGRLSNAGLVALGVAWTFAFLVGIFPEQAGAVHTNVSAVAFLAAGVALGVLGESLRRIGSWRAVGRMAIAGSVVTLGSFLVFASQQGEGAYAGVWERLIIAPILLWSIVTGYRLLFGPRAGLSSTPDLRSASVAPRPGPLRQ